MNNKIHKYDSSQTNPVALAATYGPATVGVEYDAASTIGALELVPDTNGKRYLFPTLRKAGAPTNGTTGSGAGFMAPGSFYWDSTNKLSYINIGTMASPTWVPEGLGIPTLTLVTASGALTKGTTSVITKAGVAAMTLAAGVAGLPGTGDDGVLLQITSVTAFAHTITATGLLQTGGAAVNVATFNPVAGASLLLMSYNAKWVVLAANGVSFT